MAIPFYEPKPQTTPNQQHLNTLNHSVNSAFSPVYDQVDGIGQAMPPAEPMPVATASTFLTPPPSPATAVPATSSSILEAISAPSAASYEEQAVAWKILAITMCKALKEYYQQTASSKDAFTNQTVQVLPNGQVQPLWK